MCYAVCYAVCYGVCYAVCYAKTLINFGESYLVPSLSTINFCRVDPYGYRVDDQKVRGRHVLKAGSTEDLGAHGLNVHGFRICRFAASRGCAAHGALRAHFGLEILLKIKPNEKYENLKFWLQTTT